MLITPIAPYGSEESQNQCTFREYGWMPTLNPQQLLTASHHLCNSSFELPLVLCPKREDWELRRSEEWTLCAKIHT